MAQRNTRSSTTFIPPSEGTHPPARVRRSAAEVQAEKEAKQKAKEADATAKQEQAEAKLAARREQAEARAAVRKELADAKAAEKREQAEAKAAAKKRQAEMKAAAKEEQSQVKAAAKKKGQTRVAQLEDKMAMEDAQREVTRVGMANLKRSRKPRHETPSTVADEGNKVDETDQGSVLTDLDASDNDRPKKKSKKNNFSTREAIKNIRKHQDMSMIVEQSEDEEKTPAGPDADDRRRVAEPDEAEKSDNEEDIAVAAGAIKNWAVNVSTWGVQSRTRIQPNSTYSHTMDATVSRRTKPVSSEVQVSKKSKTSSGKIAAARTKEENTVNPRGILNDDDLDEEVERYAALSSPIKGAGTRVRNDDIVKFENVHVAEVIELLDNGDTSKAKNKRTTSATTVKIENVDHQLPRPSKAIQSKPRLNAEATPMEVDDDDSEVDVKYKPRKVKIGNEGFTTSDLPRGAARGNRWRGMFVPTFQEYIGSLRDPWLLDDSEIIVVLQAIWDAVYKFDIQYTVDTDGPVFALAMQRVYEYRSGFGSSAMNHLESIFKSSKLYRDSLDEHAKFARAMLSKLRFAWENADSNDQSKFKGLFCGVLVLKTLAWHYTSINNHAVHVPGLYNNEDHVGIVGAVALATAAVERILVLWKTHSIMLEGGKSVILKKLNPTTGKLSRKSTLFSDANYGSKTREYAQSAANLTAARMVKVVEKARDYARVDSSSQNPIDISDEDMSDVDRANLVEVDSD
ncbi:hypothetical protein SCP_0113410 [Sparassis crispa]|uniref:Uncharacterized protein n=1 Tax=Sparassis crispa TaxID=139825 RepID=A0A401G8G7_9APHY|nr:hypothetical protein SCP_0113410 [Sparassis crispa]GBE78452.1 hypothetical protein SCP_0113410 [Sparassis crispa]